MLLRTFLLSLLLGSVLFVLTVVFTNPQTVRPLLQSINSQLPASKHANLFASMSSTPDPFFLSSAPLAALAWKQLGVESLICLIGSPSEYNSSLIMPSLKLLEKLDVKITYLPGPFSLKKATLAQHCRLYAVLSDLPLAPEDIIITADSDYIPLHLNEHWDDGIDIFLFNSNCCGTDSLRGTSFPHLPVVSVAMRTHIFRDVFADSIAKYDNAQSIEKELQRYFEQEIREAEQSKSLRELQQKRMWYSDQILFSYRIHKWRSRSRRVIKTGEFRGPINRFDRSSFLAENFSHLNLTRFSDMHLMRPALAYWSEMRLLFKRFLSAELFALADEYGKVMEPLIKNSSKAADKSSF